MSIIVNYKVSIYFKFVLILIWFIVDWMKQQLTHAKNQIMELKATQKEREEQREGKTEDEVREAEIKAKLGTATVDAMTKKNPTSELKTKYLLTKFETTLLHLQNA